MVGEIETVVRHGWGKVLSLLSSERRDGSVAATTARQPRQLQVHVGECCYFDRVSTVVLLIVAEHRPNKSDVHTVCFAVVARTLCVVSVM